MTPSLDALRVAARTLRKQPVFTTVVGLSLALAIALNTTMYSVLDAITHPRLDMRKPDQLYWIRFYGDFRNRVDTKTRDAALAAGTRSYDAITWTGFGNARGVLSHGSNLVEGSAMGVATNFFDVVGPRVVAGRTFVPSDVDAPNAPIVITQSVARTLFTGHEAVVGSTIDIEQTPHTVIGVITDKSNPGGAQAWMPAALETKGMFVRLIRLRDGYTAAQAQRELDLIAVRIAGLSGENPRDVAFRFGKAIDTDFAVRPFHYALVLAVVSVLLVACANLANLQLARGISRRRDLALRSALGATRARLVRHLLCESLLLAAGGLAAGLLLTWAGGKLLIASIPPSMGNFAVETHLSWRVLLFALLATLVCLLLVGLAPSIYVSRADPNDLLKTGAGTGSTRHNRRRYGVLVSVEIALALALSSAAALAVRNAMFWGRTGVGFDPRPLAAGWMFRSGTQGGAVVRYSEILQDIAQRVKAVKGVEDAAASAGLSFTGGAVTVEDAGGVREYASGRGAMMVTPSYLRTLHLPIIRGRDFLEGERDAGGVIVDDHTAHMLWPNANPLGAQIKLGDLKSNRPYVRVVGVVGEQPGFESTNDHGLFMRNVRELGSIYYLPGPADTISPNSPMGIQFVARTAGDPGQLSLLLRQSLHFNGSYATRAIQPMEDFLGITVKRQSAEFTSELFTLFAVLGVGLAAFGVYGVVAHSVAERRRELGVRIALGATARDILRSVLRESAVVALAGAAGGLFFTKYAARYLQALALEDDVYNAPLFAGVALALMVATVVAAMIPAMRATRVDPTESLRNE